MKLKLNGMFGMFGNVTMLPLDDIETDIYWELVILKYIICEKLLFLTFPKTCENCAQSWVILGIVYIPQGITRFSLEIFQLLFHGALEYWPWLCDEILASVIFV